MPRGRPVDDTTRARVRQLHTDGWSRNAIARDIGISGSTVTGIVRSSGGSFDRSATVEATEAARADAAERRAQLSAALLDDAHRLRAQLWKPTRHGAFGGKDNTWSEVSLEEPTFPDKRAITASVGNLIRDHVRLEHVDTDTGHAEASAMLTDLHTAIATAVASLDNDGEPTEPE